MTTISEEMTHTSMNNAQSAPDYPQNNEFDTDRTLARCREALNSRGYHAGRSGAIAAVPERLVDAFAERYLLRHWNGKRSEIAKRRAEVARRTMEKAITGEQFEQSRTSSRYLWAERDAHAHRFSIPLGLFFILISLVLFFTDFPLSLSLVADAFDMPVKYLNAPVSELVASLMHQSWETVFLSVGIAIFPVVLKIPYQHLIARAEAPVTSAGRGQRSIAAVMLVVTLLTVSTLIFLAIFRSDARSHKLHAEEQQSREEFREKQMEVLGPSAKSVDEQSQQTSFTDTTTGVAKWSFILLTLTLPVLATIAFSEGVANIQRNRSLPRSERDLQKFKSEHLSSVASETQAREQLETLEESIRSGTAAEAWREIARQQGISIYLGAHERGRREWIEEFKNRSLYDTMVLNASEELSPAAGNAFSEVLGGSIQ